MAESMVTIRAAKPEDIESLAELLTELGAEDEDSASEAETLRQGFTLMLQDAGSRTILVADERGRIVGACSLQLVVNLSRGGMAALSENLIVSKKDRGVGIGSDLLRAAQNWAANRGASILQIMVDGENIPALEFLMKNGWRRSNAIRVRRFLP